LPKGKIMADKVTLPNRQLRLNADASESEVGLSGSLPARGEIGFIGLGHMGTAMAANLAAAGYRVIACDRRPDRRGKLAGVDLTPTTEIADLFDCAVVVSMLPDDSAVRDVALGQEDASGKGLVSGLKRGAIHLSMSTISTSTASRLSAEHARHGQSYVAAPVLGSPDAAKARQLFILAAGAPADVARCQRCLTVSDKKRSLSALILRKPTSSSCSAT
jgi:3-hydroxyisobutyrate dehydrogenase-like beta-hydroxyacid dehydrogenase